MSVEELFGPDETNSENDEEDNNDVPSEHDDDSDFEGQEPPTAPARDDQRPAQEDQEAPFNTNNVEEDGHVNADGVDYRQPRAPFYGCAWCGTKNAFIRTDEQNTSKPQDSRPQGYIWVASIIGFCRTLAQTLADEVRLTAQMAQRQRPQGTSQRRSSARTCRTTRSWKWPGTSVRLVTMLRMYGLTASVRRSVWPLTCAVRTAARRQ